MSPPSPNLSNLPTTALDLIFQDANLETIQILRKVCRSLRSHIDNTHQLDIKSHGIEVRAIPTGFLKMDFLTKGKKYSISYQQNESSCQIEYENRSKIIDNQDFISLAGNDLGLILRHQKSELSDLALQFPRQEGSRREDSEALDTFGGRFLAQLEPHLKSRNSLLKTFEFVLRGTNQQSQVLKVLPYLDPDELNRIEITTTKDTEEEPSQIMKMDQIVEMEQWKNAKEVYIDLLYCDTALGNFNHFVKAQFEIMKVSTTELVELREAIFKCRDFEDFRVEYRLLTDKKKLMKAFGKQFIGSTSQKKIWYHKMQNMKKALYIAWVEKKRVFKFYAIRLADVPENAFG